jgi:hypothetical protein
MATAKDKDGSELKTTVREISVSKESGLAFVTTVNSIQVIDFKEPGNPRLLTEIVMLPDPSGALTASGSPVMLPIGAIPAIVERGGWVYLASQSQGLKVVDLDPAIITITVPTIRIDNPISGYALDDFIPITYKMIEFGDFSPYSANMYIYENDGVGDRLITQFTNIPHKGTNTINFPAKLTGTLFDVRKRYEVEVAFNESILFGMMRIPSTKRIRFPLEWQAIATDYNRDGKIDAADMEVARNDNVYYFWINDNDDVDDVTGNSIPGSGTDWRKGNVSGTRDLVDFFPVHMDIAALVNTLPPQSYKYVLK